MPIVTEVELLNGKVTADKFYVERATAEATLEFIKGDIQKSENNYADITAARTILGFEPKWNFNDGIGEFCKWVNKQEIQEDKYEISIEEMKKKGLYK